MIGQIDPGLVGSPLDFATFVLVLVLYERRVREPLATMKASVVALARPREDVDDDQLQSELEVDDRDVESLQEEVVQQ